VGCNCFTQLATYAAALTDSPLRPASVVLCVNPSLLHSRDRTYFDTSMAGLLDHLRHRHVRLAAQDCSWVYRHQDTLVDYAEITLHKAARRFQSECGLPMYAMFNPEENPFRLSNYYNEPHASASYIAMQLPRYQNRVDPSQFQSCDRQMEVFGDLVTTFRRNGANVVCLLMPEDSIFRSIHPPIVLQRFDQAIAKVDSAGPPLPVVNLRSAAPDAQFYDYVHLNSLGRQQLSNQLPALVN
jgi:hypothetical protein